MYNKSSIPCRDTHLSNNTRAQRGTGAILLEFLGSMNLAITLLVVIAISSVIGTVLKQNEPYQDYIIKFGSFWFEVYKALGLYDVYSAAWFLVIMGFLLVSTSVCVYRNAPTMLRDMRAFRENVTATSLRGFHHRAEWRLPANAAATTDSITQHLTSYGYRVRTKVHPDYTVLASMKGAANRLGYIFTHVAIVVICIGGLLDGNMPLKVAEMLGKIKVETRTLPTSQVPKISRLPVNNSSFRGLISIPEGSVAKHIEVKIRDGYLLQELPFEVEVKKFRIEHYPSGQPKSFESDLIIYDKELAQPLQHTISVNHPLIYKGYAIYQANFGDGGSKLQLHAWPLSNTATAALDTQGEIGKSTKLESPQGPLTLEFIDFRFFNVKPAPPDSGKQFRDLGPSVIFKVRNAAGSAFEYENYMQPVEQQGRLFFISGMRETPNDEYRYLQMPADAKGSVERFMRFRVALLDKQRQQQAASQTALSSLGKDAESNPKIHQTLTRVVQRLLDNFVSGGFEAVTAYLQANLPAQQREQAATHFVDLLQQALQVIYNQVLAQEGAQAVAASAEQDNRQFFEDALNALGAMAQYNSPYYLQLTDFQQIQASGLQITRAPGKNVVYLGFGMLIIGVFIMFYLPQRRLWAWIRQEPDATTVIFAGSSNRDRIGFSREFAVVQEGLEARLTAQ